LVQNRIDWTKESEGHAVHFGSELNQRRTRVTEFEHATIAAHLAAALVTAHGQLAAAGVPLKQPQNQNDARIVSALTPRGAVALYRDVLAELNKSSL
jgi:hypothetical protein